MSKMPFITCVRVAMPAWRNLSCGVSRPLIRQYRFPSYAARLRFQQLVTASGGEAKPHVLRLEAIRWARSHDCSTPDKACPIPVGPGGALIITQDMPRYIRAVGA